MRAGCFALCPHTNTRHFDKELPDEVFLAGTLEMLRRSDAILLIPGWTRSQRKAGRPTSRGDPSRPTREFASARNR